MGTYLPIDEIALSQEELYKIVTNKKFKGKRGSLVAITARTKADQIIENIYKIDYKKRGSVKKKLDMAKLVRWYRNVKKSSFKNFNILLNTVTIIMLLTRSVLKFELDNYPFVLNNLFHFKQPNFALLI